jgi:hypothetical protein
MLTPASYHPSVLLNEINSKMDNLRSKLANVVATTPREVIAEIPQDDSLSTIN